jgi:hypothetical protein
MIEVIIDGHTMPPPRKSFTSIDEAELVAARVRRFGRALSGGDRG